MKNIDDTLLRICWCLVAIGFVLLVASIAGAVTGHGC